MLDNIKPNHISVVKILCGAKKIKFTIPIDMVREEDKENLCTDCLNELNWYIKNERS